MNELLSILDRDIYPRVFEKADQIFPEFEFKREGGHWISSNTLKIDGTHGKEKGKVYIYPDRPHLLNDFRLNPIEITKYLKDTGRASSWIDAVSLLAQDVGFKLPDTHYDNKQSPPLRTSIYEALNDLFIETLRNEPKDNKHWQYLKQRGYEGLLLCEAEDSKTYMMELGAAPSRERQKQYLLDHGFTEKEINNNYLYHEENGKTFETNKSIGDSHTLTIPYRNISGRIIGFSVRNIDHKKGDEKPKYIVTKGLKKEDKLFNLTSRKSLYEDVNLVEGYLDALYTKALGMPNVIALGSVGFNKDQAQLLKVTGVKRVTLLLDEDTTGKNAIDKVIDILRNECEEIKIYVASLPENFKDPDELIRKHGISSFKKVIEEAANWYIYQLKVLLSLITKTTTDKERDSIIEKIISLGGKLNRIEQNHFAVSYQELGALIGLSADTLVQALKNNRKKNQEEKYKRELSKFNNDLDIATKNGDYKAVKDIHNNIGKHLNKGIDNNFIDNLLVPVTEDSFILEYRNEPPAVETSYKISKLPLAFNSAALSFIVAPTGKGKTTTLINLALDMVRNHRKKVLLLTLEETTRALTLKALNTYIGSMLRYPEDNNRSILKNYFKTGDSSSIKYSEFSKKKEGFFNLIKDNSLMIRNVGSDIEDIIKAIHALHERNLIHVVFIDYIQLIRINSRYGSRQEEIKAIVNKLKECAHSTGLPFIIAGQFNRQAIIQDEDTLSLTNIGEAGDIERIADLVLTVYFDNAVTQANGSYELTMKILKNRDGISGLSSKFDFFGNEGVIKEKQIESFGKAYTDFYEPTFPNEGNL